MTNQPPLRVLHVASEATPFAKTGGLADVASALPRAQAHLGMAPMLVIPRYREIDPARHNLARRVLPIDVPLGGRTERVTLFEGRLPGGQVPVYLVDHPLFDRDGIYGDAGGDYPDNGLRFGLLCRAALEIAARLDAWPQIVHAHDWQGALALLFAKRGAVAGRPAPATVQTLHNLAFRGLAPKALIDELGLGWDLYNADAIEFYDQVCLIKAGLRFADRIVAVSPRYAREIQTPEQGADLDGFLRARRERITGILNGIDTDVWNPAHDRHLPATYDAENRMGKTECKARLQRELGLPVSRAVPLIGSVSRLTEQKGFDLVAQAGEDLARLEAQFIFLGAGDRRHEQALMGLATRYPTRFAVRTGYDDRLAHLIEAGADYFLMPSRFEPCGLSQLYSLRYGTIPIVRATGGLDDTVVDYDSATGTGTGFKFSEYDPSALVGCVRRAIGLAQRGAELAQLSSTIMKLDYSWDVSARRYAEVYRQLV